MLMDGFEQVSLDGNIPKVSCVYLLMNGNELNYSTSECKKMRKNGILYGEKLR